MRVSAQPKNKSKLSEIIMEINGLRELPSAPDRPKQERRWFSTLTFRR
jgi:hypothetical protein